MHDVKSERHVVRCTRQKQSFQLEGLVLFRVSQERQRRR